MNYEIVNLKEKIIVGVSTTTSNDDPKMVEKIGGLWDELYQDGVNAKIKNKVNEYAIGLYLLICDLSILSSALLYI